MPAVIASLPRGMDPDTVTVDGAVALLAARAEKAKGAPAKRPRAARPKAAAKAKRPTKAKAKPKAAKPAQAE